MVDHCEREVRMGVIESKKRGGIRNPEGEMNPSGARNDPLPKSFVKASTREVTIDSLGNRRFGVGICGTSIQHYNSSVFGCTANPRSKLGAHTIRCKGIQQDSPMSGALWWI